ncbi:hypothetical protein GF357_04445 [Candidatus Dojkabacteria bacterium]|nr:hypothetical protein [Candidatus Dojkabacteria bacterium]
MSLKRILKAQQIKLAIIYAISSSVIILVASFLTIIVINKQIKQSTKIELKENLDKVILDFTQNNLQDVEIDYQKSTLDGTSRLVTPPPNANTIIQNDSETANDSITNQKNLPLNQEYAAPISGDIGESNKQSDRGNFYTRIITQEGNILYTSELFDKYYIDWKRLGFSVYRNPETVIYVYTARLTSSSDKSVTIQVAKYSPITPEMRSKLTRSIILISILMSIPTYFIGFVLAKIFILPIRKAAHTTRHFIQNVNHELMTPLTVALSSVEAALCTGKYESGLNSLKKDLLDIKKSLGNLRKNSISFEDENYHINKVNVSKLASSTIKKVSRADSRITSKIQSNITKRTNENIAGIIFTNLIKNALQHSPDNSKVQIILDQYTFSVTNQIRPNSKLTTKLLKKRMKAHENSQSHGIGLSIAKSLADKLGWKLRVSMTNNHVTFSVRFPG